MAEMDYTKFDILHIGKGIYISVIRIRKVILVSRQH
jgi:hypothetical protein